MKNGLVKVAVFIIMGLGMSLIHAGDKADRCIQKVLEKLQISKELNALDKVVALYFLQHSRQCLSKIFDEENNDGCLSRIFSQVIDRYREQGDKDAIDALNLVMVFINDLWERRFDEFGAEEGI